MYARSGWNGPAQNPGDSPETGGFYGKDHKPNPWRARWNRRRGGSGILGSGSSSPLAGRLLGAAALLCVLYVVAFLRPGNKQGGEELLSSWQQQTLGQQQQQQRTSSSVLPPPPPPRPRPPATTATETKTPTSTTSTPPPPPPPLLPASFAAVRSRAPRQQLVLDDRSVRCRVGKVCEGWRACPAEKTKKTKNVGSDGGAADDDDADPLGCVTAAPERAALVRAAIKGSWDAYAASAFGADELAPLSNSSHAWFDLGLTLVDALDTLLIAGLEAEYLAARRWVGAGAADGTQRPRGSGAAGNLPSGSGDPPPVAGSKEAGGLALDPEKEVNLFETTIRVLGGLLSAAHLEPRWLNKERRSGGGGGGGSAGASADATAGGMALPLLSAAAQLGIRLSPALEGVGGIEIASGGEEEKRRRRRRRRRGGGKQANPAAAAAASDGGGGGAARRRRRVVPLSDVSLRRLEAAGPAWTSFSSLSEATTLSMEFSFLSRATTTRGKRRGGDDENKDDDGLLRSAAAAALSAARSVAAAAAALDPPSLPPIWVDPESGALSSGTITLGARGDSYYEYLLKQWLLGGKKGEREGGRGEGRRGVGKASSTSTSTASSGDETGGDDGGEIEGDDDDDDDDDGPWMRDAYVSSMRSLRARLVSRAPLPSTSDGQEEERGGGSADGGGGEREGGDSERETVPSLQRRRGGLAYVREVLNGADSPKMDHLVCFLPGLLALGAAHGVDTRRRAPEGAESASSFSSSSATGAAAKSQNSSSSASNPSSPFSFHPGDDEDVALAAQLALTCAEMYRGVPAGLAPEIVHFRARKEGGGGGGGGGAGDRGAVIPGAVGAAEGTVERGREAEIGHGAFDVKPADAHNLLRPEAVESWFVLWRLTGDEAYREWGWAAFRAWSKFSRVRGGGGGGGGSGGSGTAAAAASDGGRRSPSSSSSLGFANLDSVLEVPPRQRDKMESFWVAETLKYLYLMFDDEAAARLPLDQYVFNTEAHPLPVRGSAADRAASRGYLSLPPPPESFLGGGGDSPSSSSSSSLPRPEDPAAASEAAEAAQLFAERTFLRSRAAGWAAAGTAAVAAEEGARARAAAAARGGGGG